MKSFPLRAAAIIIAMSMLSCRPVVAIGWEELVVIVIVAGLLLGPLMFRMARFWIRFQEGMKQDKHKK